MIGYYVHHHGSGHLARARAVARAVRDGSGEPVVALTSHPDLGADEPFADRVTLAPDEPIAGARDATAGGALHWAPVNSPGYGERMHQLARWCAAARPRLVVVDVSVEVAVFVRLLGVPVAVVTLPGERTDPPHVLARTLADRIVAPWPRAVYAPAWLAPHLAKTVFTGALSRFDGCAVTPPPTEPTALLLFGSGGGGPSPEAVADLAAATGWTCRGLGGAGLPWAEDVWDALGAAAVVVTHAGLNAVAEVAAARRPAVVIAADRPFAEQATTADALHAAGLAVTSDGWPESTAWPALLDAASGIDPARWAVWDDGRGAARFAAALA